MFIYLLLASVIKSVIWYYNLELHLLFRTNTVSTQVKKIQVLNDPNNNFLAPVSTGNNYSLVSFYYSFALVNVN